MFRQWKPRLSGVFVAVLLLSASGCDKIGQHTEQESMVLAKNFYSKGELSAAVIELKNALKKNPNNTEARWLLGEVYLDIGKGADAEKELDQAKKLGVGAEALFIPKGRALLLQQRYDLALAHLKTPHNDSPQFLAQVETLRGEALIGLKQGAEGCATLEKAKGLDPKHVRAYLGLARCAISKRQPEQAKADLLQAISIEPLNDATLTMLGDYERILGQSATAKSYYDKALKQRPNNLDALAGRAAISIAEEKFLEAKQYAKKIHTVAKGHPTGYLLHGIANYAEHNYADARSDFDNVLKADPGNLPGLLWSGMTNYSLQNYETAQVQLAVVVERDRNNAQARRVLGASYLRMGLPARALETVKPLIGADSKDSKALTLAGEAYFSQKQPDRANEFFQRAATLDPKDATIRSGLGLSQLSAGNTAQAIADLEVASSLNEQEIRADMLLATVRLRDKQYDQAIQVAQRMIKKRPKEPMPLNVMGVAYVGKQDYASARKYFEQALSLAPTFFDAASNLAGLDLRDKNPKAARGRFEALLKADKDNLPAMMALAAMAMQTNQDKEALEWYERASKANPGALPPRLALVRYHLAHNNPQQAISIAREAQEKAPEVAEVLELLGATQLAVGERENALVSYRKLVDLNPKDALAYAKLGNIQSTLGRVNDARQTLAKALELNPDNTVIIEEMIMVEVAAKRFDVAMRLTKEAQARYPKYQRGYVLEGDIWYGQRRFAEALKAYEAAFALAPSGRLVSQVHQVLVLMNKRSEAKARVDEWLKTHPADVTVLGYLAERALAESRYQEAIGHYESLLKAGPKNLLALNNLAGLYQHEKDPRALNIAEQAYQLDPDSAGVLDTLGWILLEQGKVDRAVDLLAKAVQSAPGIPVSRYRYAVALEKSGNRLEAKKQIEVALASKTPFTERAEAQAVLARLKK